MSASPALLVLLDGLIDYAGLFPPANVSMEEMIRAFQRHRAGSHANFSARCIVPLARLEEFEQSLAAVPEAAHEGWRLSALGSGDSAADWNRINEFNLRHPSARIVSVEIRASSAAEIATIAMAFPPILELWIEIPAREDCAPLRTAIRDVHRAAKIRTGGITPEAFPSAQDVAQFLAGCHRTGVIAKATAGLHHPITSVHPLSSEASAPTGQMFGFLNVFLAAALTRKGAALERVGTLLLDGDAMNFRCTPQAISWRDHSFSAADLGATRQSLLRSFGSCSLTEPIEGLQALGWI